MVKQWMCNLNQGMDVLQSELQEQNSIFSVTGYFSNTDDIYLLELTHDYEMVYGLGERFDSVNQKGRSVRVEVIEKFCNQGEFSYCPMPFFFTNQGLGVFVDTRTVTEFSFGEKIKIFIKKDSKEKLPVVYFFTGTPKEIISQYSNITGRPLITPKWSFGPWMSANRWNTEEEVYRQIELMKKHELPHSVMVLEAWSDEATFYRFNEHGEWKSPEEMVKYCNTNGLNLVLWQIPVLKRMDNGERHPVLDADWEYAIQHGLCIKNADGTPYTIPENHWFSGSLLPDFTNPETVKWWFGKRQYLLDMGVSGFKTDGGEFILRDDVVSFNGMTGLELRNFYASGYVEAYSDFIGKNRVLFSRAGYVGQQKFPMQWAGDQMSTWEEFKHILIAGISIGLSGVPFWGFDIAGFAGDMPGLSLYERATQCAVFAPVMQWHSEPAGGQFAELLPSTQGINDRSPWNISLLYQDEELISRLKFHYNLRMNLLPYIYNLALNSGENGLPMMKHLILEYPEDRKVYGIEDCFMLGELLVAPVTEEAAEGREVYLPEGMWSSLWPMKTERMEEPELLRLTGGCSYRIVSGYDRIPVFVRDGGCLALNLGEEGCLGDCVGNDMEHYRSLSFWMYGSAGEYHFKDDRGNQVKLQWKDGKHTVERISGDTEFTVCNKTKLE